MPRLTARLLRIERDLLHLDADGLAVGPGRAGPGRRPIRSSQRVELPGAGERRALWCVVAGGGRGGRRPRASRAVAIGMVAAACGVRTTSVPAPGPSPATDGIVVESAPRSRRAPRPTGSHVRARRRGRPGGRARCRSRTRSAVLRLTSPPSTSGVAPGPSGGLGGAARSAWRGASPCACAWRFGDPRSRRARTACITRRSGRRRSVRVRCSTRSQPAHEDRVAPPPALALIRSSGRRSATARRGGSRDVPRRQRAPLDRPGGRPAAGGHHGGTSCRSATSQYQPASAPRTRRAAAARVGNRPAMEEVPGQDEDARR